MKAITFREFGGPEVLRPTEVEMPQCAPGDVLVRIHAAGICYHDLLSRAGKIPGTPGRILGHEIAGEIVAAGEVSPERVGERVVLYQRLFCGQCRQCLAGRQDLAATAAFSASTAAAATRNLFAHRRATPSGCRTAST